MCIHTTVPVLAVSRRRWICNLTENNSRQSKVIKHTHTHTHSPVLLSRLVLKDGDSYIATGVRCFSLGVEAASGGLPAGDWVVREVLWGAVWEAFWGVVWRLVGGGVACSAVCRVVWETVLGAVPVRLDLEVWSLYVLLSLLVLPLMLPTEPIKHTYISFNFI